MATGINSKPGRARDLKQLNNVLAQPMAASSFSPTNLKKKDYGLLSGYSQIPKASKWITRMLC
jgi:hypothetical protein